MKRRVFFAFLLTLLAYLFTPALAASVDLGVNVLSLTSLPTIGSNWNWSVIATNRGVSDATNVRLQCSIPTNTTLIQSNSSFGTLIVTGGVIQVFTTNFPAGASIFLSFTLRPASGGWTTNTFTLVTTDSDIDNSDNQASISSFVGPSGASNSIERLRLSIKQLVSDRLRQQFYALERTAATNQTALYQLDGVTLKPQLLRTLPGIATHLKLSADSRFLYAAVENGRAMQRIDLEGVESDLLFDIFNPASGLRYRFFDMEPDPNDSRRIVISVSMQHPSMTEYETVTTCFKDGAQQSNTVSFLQFSSPENEASLEVDAALGIVILATDAFPNQPVQRLQLVANGVVLVGQYNYGGLSPGFKLIEGRIYSGFGDEVLADTGRRVRSLPTSQSDFGLVDYYPPKNRLVLTQSGSDGTVQVCDRLTFARLGVISLVSPTIDSSLVTDGGRLLLAGTDGQLFVVTHSLLTSSGTADLAVQLVFQPPQPQLNQPIQFIIAVTNLGPSNAAAPAVTFESPAPFNRTSVSPGSASSTGSGFFPYPLLWSTTNLAPGEGKVFQVQGSFSKAGLMKIAAGAADPETDLSPANNRVELSIPVAFSLLPGQSGRLALKAQDAVYDPVRNGILVIPTSDDPLAGQLVSVSTATGLTVSNWLVGPSPTTLIVADDQQTLYVATHGGSNITRLTLPSMQLQAQFSAAQDAPTNSAVNATKLVVNPGSPGDLLLRRSDGKLALFRNDSFQFASDYAGNDFVFFAPDRLITPKLTFSFDLYRYRLSAAALLSDGIGGPVQISGLRSGLGFVFATDGRLVDPFNLTQAGAFAGGGMATVEPSANLVYFPASSFGYGLNSFDLHTQSLIKYEPFNIGQVDDLFHTAGDVFVSRNSFGDLTIMRTEVIPVAPPADLAVGISTAGVWKAGFPCEWFLSVTNTGPNQATATRIDMRMPDKMYFAQATVPAISAVEPQVSLLVGNLEPGQSVVVKVQAIAQAAAFSSEVVVSTRSSAVDPDYSNNVARLVQPIECSHILDRVDFLSLPATDAIFDPISQMLYLVCPQISASVTNVLLELDPARGIIQRQISLPGFPGKLALSPGGEYLYVCLNAAQQVLRLTLPALETNLLFNTLQDALPGPNCDMVVLPGSPTSVAFSRFGGGTPSPGGVWIFDNDQPRTNFVPGGYDGVTFIEPGSSSNTLVALAYSAPKFRPLTIMPGGLIAQPATGDEWTSFIDFGVGGTNMLVADRIFDRSTFNLRAILPVPFPFQSIALSPAGDRAVLVAGSNRAVNPMDFAGFRIDPMTLAGSIRIPGPPVNISKLVLWSTNGVAALSSDGYLFLGRLHLAGPFTSDGDSDGMPDDWELENNLDPSTANASADPDLDGSSNIAEYYFGTNPNSTDSAPRIQVDRIGNKLRLLFSCAGGKHFYVERASALTGPWTTVSDAVSNGGFQFYDHVIPTSVGRFYFRVRITP